MEGNLCEYYGAQLNQMEKLITVHRHCKAEHFIMKERPG